MKPCACLTPKNSGIHTPSYCGPRFSIQTKENAKMHGFRITDNLGDHRIATCYDRDNANMICNCLNAFHSRPVHADKVKNVPDLDAALKTPESVDFKFLALSTHSRKECAQLALLLGYAALGSTLSLKDKPDREQTLVALKDAMLLVERNSKPVRHE